MLPSSCEMLWLLAIMVQLVWKYSMINLEEDARIIAKDGYRSLTSLMDDVKKQEPEIPINVIDLPKRGTIDSVSFIEFISRNEEARSIEKQLVSLGFKKTAVHSEKLMTCWEQEQIRIILNEEKTQESKDFGTLLVLLYVIDLSFLIPKRLLKEQRTWSQISPRGSVTSKQ